MTIRAGHRTHAHPQNGTPAMLGGAPQHPPMTFTV